MKLVKALEKLVIKTKKYSIRQTNKVHSEYSIREAIVTF
jgi:hypothetical protein